MKSRYIFIYNGFEKRSGGALNHAKELSLYLKNKKIDSQIYTLDSLPIIIRFIPHLFLYSFSIISKGLALILKHKISSLFFKYFLPIKRNDIIIFEDIYLSWNHPKYCMVLHALISDNMHSFKHTKFDLYLLRSIERKIINRKKEIIYTVSKEYLEFVNYTLKTNLKNHIALFTSFKPNNKHIRNHENSLKIVTISWLETRKNILFLIKIAKRLKELNIKYKWDIIGDGELKKTLIKEIDKYGLKKYIKLLGRKTKKELENKLQDYDLFILTSKKESFSFALLEARLSNLPTIAYKYLEVPKKFISIPVENWELNLWVEKIINYRKLKIKKFSGKEFSAKYHFENLKNLIY